VVALCILAGLLFYGFAAHFSGRPLAIFFWLMTYLAFVIAFFSLR
jgi:hypothetical protein